MNLIVRNENQEIKVKNLESKNLGGDMMKMILLKVLFFCITLTLFSSIVVAEVDCKTECVEWETKEECKIVGPDSESKICELRTVCKRYEKRCKEPMLKSDKNGSDKKSE